MKTDIIKQLEALNPKELIRVSNAVHEKLCSHSDTKHLPTLPSLFGFQGLLMQANIIAKWNEEKAIELTRP